MFRIQEGGDDVSLDSLRPESPQSAARALAPSVTSGSSMHAAITPLSPSRAAGGGVGGGGGGGGLSGEIDGSVKVFVRVRPLNSSEISKKEQK